MNQLNYLMQYIQHLAHAVGGDLMPSEMMERNTPSDDSTETNLPGDWDEVCRFLVNASTEV